MTSTSSHSSSRRRILPIVIVIVIIINELMNKINKHVPRMTSDDAIKKIHSLPYGMIISLLFKLLHCMTVHNYNYSHN
jgi:uncharacterized protein YacL